MSKKLKIGGGILGFLTVLGIIFGFFILPNVFASKEKEALQKLEKKGVEINYASLDTYLSGVFSFHDFSIKTNKKGLAIDCNFKKIQVDIALFASLSGKPKITDVELEGGRCEVEKKKKKNTSKKEPTKDTSKKALLSGITFPTLKIADTIIRFKRNSLRINDFSSVSKGPIKGNLTLRALGEKYEINISGVVEKEDIQIALTPVSRESFDVNILGNKFKMGSMGALLSLKNSNLKSFVKQLSVQRKGFSIQTQKAGAEFSMSAKPKFFIEATKVQFDKDILKNFVAPKKEKSQNFDSVEPLVSPFEILDKLELRFSDFALSMNISGREIGLIEKANGRWVRGVLDIDGEIAKGKIKAHAILSPKEKKIYSLDADIENVQLGALPGMPSGRSTLPNRGTSGKLDGLISGMFRLQTPLYLAANNTVDYAMNVQWKDGVLDLEGVSEEPLDGIEVSALVQGKVNLSTFEIINQGILYSQDSPFSFHSKISGWPEDIAATFSLKGETQPCAKYFSALPKAVWGPLKNATLSGDATLKIEIEYAKSRPQETNLSIKGYKKCVVEDLKSNQALKVKIAGNKTPDLSDVGWLEKPFIRKVREVDAGKEVFVGPGTKSYTSIGSLPKHVGASAYLSEQMNFYTGRAVNFALIQRAVRRNLDEGRFVYGGSTITQQLVKNLFLTRDKTLARKLQEVLIAWRMESVLSKDKILELYLNCIEFGPNLYGIGRAAQHYFQKSATQLTPKESVFLAMLKPAPWRGVWYVNRGATPTNPYFLERTDILLDRLVEKEIISEELRESERRVGLTWKEGKYLRVLLPETVEEESALEILTD